MNHQRWRRLAALLLAAAVCLISCGALAEGLTARLSASAQYAMVGKKAMQYTISVSGGTAPYTISAQVQKDGAVLYSTQLSLGEAGKTSFSFMPSYLGTHNVSIQVTDAAGGTAGASAQMQVSLNEYEPKEKWDASVSGVSSASGKCSTTRPFRLLMVHHILRARDSAALVSSQSISSAVPFRLTRRSTSKCSSTLSSAASAAREPSI